MTFQFATAGRIVFGPGASAQIGALARPLGRRALVVVGQTPTRTEPLLARLAAHGLTATTFSVATEPTIAVVQAGVAEGQAAGVDLVIGIGGGSVIDAAKAMSALLTNPGSPLDYLELIGAGKPLVAPPLPYIAVPTTAGTGAEVTKNAVLASPEHRVKVSLRSDAMLPAVALVDPELTHSMPPQVTASTGLDALTQCLEPFVSHLSSPLTDGFCREGMQRAARALRRAVRDGSDADARSDMAIAGLCGGLALANAKLGAVHGFAGPLGGMLFMPHGVICGRLLPLVTAQNIRALRQRAPAAPALERYDEAARILTGDSAATAADGVRWIEELVADLAVPGLAAFGLSEEHFADLIPAAQRAGSMRGNPVVLEDEELAEILRGALT